MVSAKNLVRAPISLDLGVGGLGFMRSRAICGWSEELRYWIGPCNRSWARTTAGNNPVRRGVASDFANLRVVALPNGLGFVGQVRRPETAHREPEESGQQSVSSIYHGSFAGAALVGRSLLRCSDDDDAHLVARSKAAHPPTSRTLPTKRMLRHQSIRATRSIETEDLGV